MSNTDEALEQGVKEALHEHVNEVTQQGGYLEEAKLSNQVSDINERAELDRFEDQFKNYTAEIALADTDLAACDSQIRHLQSCRNDIERRRNQLLRRRTAVKVAQRAYVDAMDDVE